MDKKKKKKHLNQKQVDDKLGKIVAEMNANNTGLAGPLGSALDLINSNEVEFKVSKKYGYFQQALSVAVTSSKTETSRRLIEDILKALKIKLNE